MAEFEVPDLIRDSGLVGVGNIIYSAVSPDVLDGLSDSEFAILQKQGVDLFYLMELGKRAGAPGLPVGFAKHFKDDVIPDIAKVRNDPEMRDEVRLRIRELLNNPKRVHDLYRDGGETYSQILRDATLGVRSVPIGSTTLMSEGMFRRSPRAGRNRRN